MKHITKLFLPFCFLSSSFAFANEKPIFSPYADITINTRWDSTYGDMEPMDLSQISAISGIKNYHLAFITDSGNCSPAWGGQSTFSASMGWGSHMTDKLRANGIDYIISLGGANGSDLSAACSATNLVSAYEQIIQTYQPAGVDFDIENGSADVPKVMKALKQVQNTHPNLKLSFTLPVLPEGLNASGEEIVKSAQENGLNFSVNIMAMDFGPYYNQKTMGQYAIQASTNLFTFLKVIYPQKSEADLWQMIEVTPMIGVNDVNVEQFTLKDVDTLLDFAQQKNLKSLSIWSVARDNPCADKWASPICSGNNLQAKPYEFSERFLQTHYK